MFGRSFYISLRNNHENIDYLVRKHLLEKENKRIRERESDRQTEIKRERQGEIKLLIKFHRKSCFLMNGQL